MRGRTRPRGVALIVCVVFAAFVLCTSALLAAHGLCCHVPGCQACKALDTGRSLLRLLGLAQMLALAWALAQARSLARWSGSLRHLLRVTLISQKVRMNN